MDKEERLKQALIAMAQLGFVPRRRDGATRRFLGELKTTQGPVEVEFRLSDLEFTSYPTLRMTTHPAFLPRLTPHVNAAGGICYFAEGTIVLDRFNPGGAILLCVEAATALLNRILADPHRAYEEALDEFLSYWAIGQTPPSRAILVGDLADKAVDADCFLLGDEATGQLLVTQSIDEARAIASALSGGVYSKRGVACWLFSTERKPVLAGSGLPETVGEFFAWLKEWDPELYKDIAFRLERDKKYLADKVVYFVIDSPYGRFGVRLPLDAFHRASLKRRPADFKNYLHGKKGQATTIQRLSATEIGTTFVHSRNLAHEDLRDKRVTVIGCGAIGGYVAQGLVRLGAGTGSRGRLTLVDGDLVGTENLARHYLGFPDLFKPKAEALRDELVRQFPLATIESKVEPVKASAALFNEHLVINATGEEAVSEMLNEYHVQRMQAGGRAASAVLHVWIKGVGECVQSLWVDTLKYGCYRCRKTPNAPADNNDRHKVLRVEVPPKFVGCQAVTPYSVSAPMAAAALALDMTAAWIGGDASPRFRTRAVESANVFKVPNKNLERIDGCPACSTKH